MSKILTVYQASDGSSGLELWITDGTAAGTSLLKDIYPGPNGSSPSGFTALGDGRMLFQANDGSSGVELWVTDGTADGTSLLKEVSPGAFSWSSAINFSPTGGPVPLGDGRVLFRADDGVTGPELWVTDGTAAGTQLVRDINLVTSSTGPSGFASSVMLDAPAILGISPDGDSQDSVGTTGAPLFTIGGTTAETSGTVHVIDGEAEVATGAVSGAGTWSATLSAPLAEGTHTLTARITLGNAISPASASYAVTTDYTPPWVAIDGPDGTTDHTTPTVTGSAEAGSTVRLYEGDTLIGETVADAQGSWSVTAAALADGAHALTATATDMVGNTGLPTPPHVITVDTVAPTAAILAFSPDTETAGDGITADRTPGFTILLSEASQILISVVDTGGQIVAQTGTSAGAGEYVYTSTDLWGGSYTLRVVTTDAVGHVQSEPATFAFTVDAPPPPPIEGTQGADELHGTGGSDTINGLGGDDILVGGGGNDTLDGGDGNDRLTGGSGDDVLLGGEGNDALDGSGTLSGIGGRDVLMGGAGDDTIIMTNFAAGSQASGGDGDDTITVIGGVGAGTVLGGGSGFDTLVVPLGSQFDPGATILDVERLTLAGVGTVAMSAAQLNGFSSITATGSPVSRFTATSAGTYDFTGKAITGFFAVTGSIGDDVIYAARMDRPPYGSDVAGGDGNDEVFGSDSAEWIQGNAGEDKLHGVDGHDVLDGGEGNDLLEGGDGYDTAVFAGAQAEYTVEAQGDSVLVTRQDGEQDVLTGIERLRFADGDILLQPVPTAAFTVPEDGTGPIGNVIADGVNAGWALSVSGFAVEGQSYGAGGTARLQDGTTLSVNSSGQVSVTPGASYQPLAQGEASAPIAFTYTLAGSWTEAQRTAAATVTVTGVNHAPVTSSEFFQVQQDADGIIGNVLANDSDPDAVDTLHVVSFRYNGQTYAAGEVAAVEPQPPYSVSGATLSIAPDGTVTLNQNNAYDALPQFMSGPFPTVQYTVADGAGATTQSVISAMIMGTDDAPVLTRFAETVATADSASIFPFADVTVTDVDFSAMLRVRITFDPAAGSFTNVYTPDAPAPVAMTDGMLEVPGLSPAMLQAWLRQLVFTPAPGQAAPGEAVPRELHLSFGDLYGPSEAAVTVTVVNSYEDGVPPENHLPSAPVLSDGAINQSEGINNSSTGSVVAGQLSAQDADPGHANSLTFALVPGEGDTDNALFLLNGRTLSAQDVRGMAPGTYSVRVSATDLRGGTTEGVVTVTVADDIAPSAPGRPDLAAASDSGNPADDVTDVLRPTLTGTAEAGSTVRLYEAGSNAVIGQGVADADGAWSITVDQDLAEGTHRLAARATDAAGNEGAGSAELAVTIDTQVADGTRLADGRLIFGRLEGGVLQLHVSDGTRGGSHAIEGVASAANTDPHLATIGGDRALFQLLLDTTTGEFGPFVTDGTPTGTQLLAETPSGSLYVYGNFALANGRALIFTGAAVFGTDGTPGGTERLELGFMTGVRSSAALTDGRTVFTSYDYAAYVTDGTAAGTQRLLPQQQGAVYEVRALDDGHVLLSAVDYSIGRPELYVFDGSTGETEALTAAHQVVSSPTNMVALGDGRALFTMSSSGLGFEIYVTDGTAAGTQLLKDILPGDSGSNPLYIAALGDGRAVFTASTPETSTEVFVTDGTEAGTRLLKDLTPGPDGSDPTGFVAIGGGRALFRAYTPEAGYKLYVTDGSEAGTQILDIVPGAAGSNPEGIVPIGGGRALFRAYAPETGFELYVTDGTAAGTQFVKDITPGAGSSNFGKFVSLGDGRAAFIAAGQVWMTDGTGAGTYSLGAGSDLAFIAGDPDTTLPASTVALLDDTGTPGDGLTADATPGFTLTRSEDSSLVVQVLDADGQVVVTETIAVGAGDAAYTTPALTDGTYTLKVVAMDLVGNVQATPATTSFAVDSAAPIATGAFGASGLAVGESALVTLDFSEAVTGLGLDDLAAEHGTLSGLTQVSETRFAVLYTATSAGTGEVRLSPSYTDRAGNAGAAATASLAVTAVGQVIVADPPAPGETTGSALAGGANDDALIGNAGDDRLNGGLGADLLTGGAGTDTFAGTAAELDGDRIEDYEAGEQIVVQGASFTAGDVTLTQGSTIIGVDLDGDGDTDLTVTLELDLPELQAMGLELQVTQGPDGTTISFVPGTDETFHVSGDIPAGTVLDGGAGDDTLVATDAVFDPGATVANIETLAVQGHVKLSAAQFAGFAAMRSATPGQAYAFHGTTAGTYDFTGSQGMSFIQGSSGHDAILGVSGFQGVIQGGGGNDLIELTSGAGGTDLLFGGEGDDILRGSEGNENLFGEAGADTLEGGGGNDYLSGGEGDDILRGGDGDDLLMADGGDHDTLEGGEGNDTLRLGALGVALADGGGGDDLIFAASVTVGMVIDGGAGADILTFSDQAQVDAGATIRHVETLVISGTAGPEPLAISLSAAQIADVTRFEASPGASFKLTLSAAGTYDFTGKVFEGLSHIVASSGDDTIRGVATENRIAIFGGDGDDVIEADSAGITLFGDAGNDTLIGGNDASVLLGGSGDDILLGGDGADNLLGDEGADLLIGGGGADIFYGGAGFDTAVYAGRRADYEIGPIGNIILTRNGGTEEVLTGVERLRFDDQEITFREDGSRTVVAAAGQSAVALSGDSGDDELIGDTGADTLNGGLGSDLLTGGAGEDTFAGTAAELDGDRIEDYEAGERIVVQGASFTAGDVTLTQGSTIIGVDLDGDGEADLTVTLELDLPELQAMGLELQVTQTENGSVISFVTGVPASTPDLAVESDTGLSDSDNVTQDNTPTFAGTARPGSTVTLYEGETIVGSGLADETGAWRITTVALADGPHSLIARATGAAGYVGAASAALAVTIDTMAPGEVRLASTSSDGTPGNSVSYGGDISADGRYVVFGSVASNLVADDGYGSSDLFVKDLATGETVRVSTASDGTPANAGFRSEPRISDDGRLVAFGSEATNLDSEDTNGFVDAFVKDLVTGEVTRVSTAADGTQGNGDSGTAVAMSGNGRHVAFYSEASNLVAGDTNGTGDLFVKDLSTGEVKLASASTQGVQGNTGDIQEFDISADGRYVVFQTIASNLVPGDTNGAWDIFVKDMQTGELSRVSTASNGAQANSASLANSISADGRYVTFGSAASNLVAGDVNGKTDIFVKDRLTGEVRLVSSAADGTQGDGTSYYYTSISADGRYVAFLSSASNLVPNDTNGEPDVFVKDLLTGGITLVSRTGDGAPGNAGSLRPIITPDGSRVIFSTAASNLADGDTNGAWDVFVADRAPSPAPNLAALSDTGASATDRLTNAPELILTGTVQAGSLVILSEAGTEIGRGMAASDGTYSIAVAGLTEGTHAIAATVTDIAGNTSSASLPVTVDRTGPTLEIAVGDTPPGAGTIDVTFTASEAISLSASAITVTGGTLGALTTADGITYTAVLTPAAGLSGPARISVTAGAYADLAGNAGAAASLEHSLDDIFHVSGEVPAETVLDGGAGDDTLVADEAVFDPGATVTNIETLLVQGTVALSAAQLADFQTIRNATYGQGYAIHATGAGIYDFSGMSLEGLGAIFGSAGDDTIRGVVPPGSYQIYAELGAGDDHFEGTAGRFSIMGGEGNDTLRGGNDGNFIAGGEGSDTLIGGDGNDTFQSNISADLESGRNTIIAGAGNDFAIGSGVGDWIDLGDGNDGGQAFGADATVIGGAGNDNIIAFNVNARIDAGDGDDFVQLSGRSEQYVGAAGSTLAGGAGKDQLVIGSDDARVHGDEGDDQIIVYGGVNAEVHGDEGDDSLIVYDSSPALIDGGSGTDTLVGTNVFSVSTVITNVETLYDSATLSAAQFAGFSNLLFFPGGTPASALAYTLTTGGLYDFTTKTLDAMGRIDGSAAGDEIRAARGTLDPATALLLSGQGGDDILTGTGSYDEIDGGEGDDTLNGGLGADLLTGGVGIDTFTGTAAELDGDTIQDYEAGERIVVRGASFTADDVTLTEGSTAIGVDLDGDGDADASFLVGQELEGLHLRVEQVAGGTAISLVASLDDTLHVSGAVPAGTVIDGGAGNDTLVADQAVFDPGAVIAHVENLVIRSSEAVQGSVTLSAAQLAGFQNIVASAPGVNIAVVASTSGLYDFRGRTTSGVFLTGSEGDDTVFLNEGALTGNHVVIGGAGNDDVTGTSAADYLTGGLGDDILRGEGGDDSLTDDDGDDMLFGGAGNDLLDAGGGANILDGGAGNDFLSTAGSGGLLTGGAGNDVLVSAAGASHNRLRGGDGDDAMLGREGDRLEGGTGDDTLYLDGPVALADGGDGADEFYATSLAPTAVIDGGAGQDWLLLDAGPIDPGVTLRHVETLVVRGAAEAGLLEISLTAAQLADIRRFEVASGGASLKLTLSEAGTYDFTGVTAQGLSQVQASSGDDVLRGLAGLGGAVLAGAGNDVLEGSAVRDILIAEAGDDILRAGDGDDFLDGGDGDDLIEGGTGADIMVGGAGTDMLSGGDGEDIVMGGAGDDALRGGLGPDRLIGNEGMDRFAGTAAELDGDIIADYEAGEEILVEGAVFSADDVTFVPGSGTIGVDLDGDGDTDLTLTLATDPGAAGLELRVAQVAGGTAISFVEASADGIFHVAGEVPAETVLDGGAGDDTLVADQAVFDPGATVANIETLEVVGSSVSLSAAQLADFRAIRSGTPGQGFNVTATTAGIYDFTARTVDGLLGITGSSGDDTILAARGALPDDIQFSLVGNDGNDVLIGTGGRDYIFGGSGDDTLSGGGGDDALFDYGGTNILDGGEGNDTLSGGGPGTRMSGGGGDDAFWIADGGVIAEGGSGDDTLHFVASGATAEGGAGNDVFLMGGGLSWQALSGGEGDDTFDIAGGPIAGGSIDGGAGHDTLVARGSIFDPGAAITGVETLKVSGSVSMSGAQLAGFTALQSETPGGQVYFTFTAAAGGTYDFTGKAIDGLVNIIGSAGDDTILAAGGVLPEGFRFLVFGRAGNDRITGTAGDDTLYGDDGDDILLGGDGDDNLYDTAGTNRLEGGAGNDNLFDSGTGSTLLGGEGDDGLYAGQGGATLDGGAGNDILGGGDGDDSLYGGEGNDRLMAYGGQNLLEGGAGDDELYGGAPGDVLRGGDGNDTIYGVGGTMEGGSGDDALWLYSDALATVEGGSGQDRLTLRASSVLDPGTVIAGVETLVVEMPPGWGPQALEVSLSGAQLAGFTSIVGNTAANPRAVTIRATTAGTYDLSGVAAAGPIALIGSGGDDVLAGTAGADTIGGGEGFDTAVYAGLRSGYQIEAAEGVIRITGPGGVQDVLTGVERLRFADQEIDPFASSSGQVIAAAPPAPGETAGAALVGDAGDDTLIGNTGDDTLNGGLGADLLTGGAGTDTYTGTASELDGDRIEDYEAGEQIVVQGASFTAGDVTLMQGSTIIGVDLDGDGDTDLTVTLELDLPELQAMGLHLQVTQTEAGSVISFVPQAQEPGAVQEGSPWGGSVLTGGAGDDVLVAQAWGNVLHGGAGDDVLDGGAGGAAIDAGTGNNLITLRGWNNVVVAGSGNNVIGMPDGNTSVTLGDGTATVTLGGWNNVVTAGIGPLTVSGPAGNSTVISAGGPTTITLGGYGNVVEVGLGDSHVIDAGRGNAHVEVAGGDAQVTARGWGNEIHAGDGDDVILGMEGSSFVWAGDGDNRVTASGWGNHVTTGSGSDVIAVSAGGSSVVSSGGGNDEIHLSGWGNRVEAGAGDDLIFSGDGGDVFVLNGPGEGVDTIHGFSQGMGDKLELDGTSAGHVAAQAVGADLSVSVDGMQVALLAGQGMLTLDDLMATNSLIFA